MKMFQKWIIKSLIIYTNLIRKLYALPPARSPARTHARTKTNTISRLGRAGALIPPTPNIYTYMCIYTQGLPPTCLVENTYRLLRPHIIKSARASMKCNPTAWGINMYQCNRLLCRPGAHEYVQKKRIRIYIYIYIYMHMHIGNVHILNGSGPRAGPGPLPRTQARSGPAPCKMCILCICIDVCMFAQIHVYQAYSTNGLH